VPDLSRVAVVGTSGAGKTTLAAALAARLDAPHVELDALFHGPAWTPVPDDVVLPAVADAVSGDRWVVDGSWFGRLGDTVLDRATTVVWLDLERPVVMFRVIRRSVARSLLRQELFNGNRESWRTWTYASHPIRWSWATMAERRVQTGERLAALPHLEIVRLRRPVETRRWLATASLGGIGTGTADGRD
jgi:adenylate kinase family enzyme